MSIESAADLDGITLAGRVVARALDAMVREIQPRMTTRDLDEIGAAVLKQHGARSAPQVVYGCPTVNLISVNDAVVLLRDLSGHGVGRTIHEPPTVLNYFDPFQRDVLTEGLVLTIEPLISARRTRLRDGEDGWTLKTANGCLAAHHEHTIVITNSEPIIVTVD